MITILYIRLRPNIVPAGAWHFYNSDSFQGMWSYLKLGLPAFGMTCLEWWTFEIVNIFAGWLSADELAANIVMTNLVYLFSVVADGIGYTISFYIGNSLGKGEHRVAKKYM